MTRKKYIIISVVIILISIIALIGASYALLTLTVEGDKKITLTAGILKVDFSEGDTINLDNTAPISDTQGSKTTPYTFTITNTHEIEFDIDWSKVFGELENGRYMLVKELDYQDYITVEFNIE